MSAVYQRISPIQKPAVKLATALLLFSTGIFAQIEPPNTASLNGTPNVVVRGQAAVKLVLAQQADVSGAFQLQTKLQRSQYVYNALTTTARQTQPAILQAISQMGLIGTGYYIANFILVQAPAGQTISSAQLQALAGRSDVATAETVTSFNTNIPAASAPSITKLPPGRGVEKNLQFINAPAVWSQGGLGQGITVGVVDSGVQWNHPLLMNHYRGLLGSGADHDYNWWDAIHTPLTSGTNPCGVNLTAPCDDLGHGTHVAGVAVGGNGKDYQIGVAPQGRFIACRDMDRGYASSGATFEECMQFMLAPWNLKGLNADPSKAPDVVVSPYHCYVSGSGCVDDPVMHTVFWNLYAAGITSVVAAEDSGQICGSTTNWPQAYPMAIVTGALDYDANSGLPSDTIASYSGAGPGNPTLMIFKPDIASPGTTVLSAVPGGNVASISGTSVAAAHMAGAIALLQSLRPNLQGRPEQIWRLIGAAPPQPVAVGSCGSPVATPNYIYGWGMLDVSVMAAETKP